MLKNQTIRFIAVLFLTLSPQLSHAAAPTSSAPDTRAMIVSVASMSGATVLGAAGMAAGVLVESCFPEYRNQICMTAAGVGGALGFALGAITALIATDQDRSAANSAESDLRAAQLNAHRMGQEYYAKQKGIPLCE